MLAHAGVEHGVRPERRLLMAVSVVAGTMAGVLGALIGSFLNVVIHRLPAG